MRRALGSLAALGLLAMTLPAPTLAARPDSFEGSQTGLLCELETTAGFITLTVQVAGGEGVAFMALWAPGTEPFEDPPTAISTTSTATLDGAGLRAAVELASPEDEERVIGTATLGVDLTADGAPMVWSRDGSDGNRRFRTEQISQLLTVEGELTVDLPDGTHGGIDLSTCGASTDSSSFFATNPNAWVYGGEQLFISCEWTTADGIVSLFGLSDDSTALSQIVVVRGDQVLLSMTDHVLSPTTYSGAFDLMDLSSGEAAGFVSADASLTRSGERIAEHVRIGAHRLSTVGDRLSVRGMLDLSIDGVNFALTMDDASCRAGDVRVQVQEKM